MKTVYKNALVAVLALTCVSVKATTWNVEVKNYEFNDNPTSVAVGDVIHWVWDEGSHTTTSTSVPAGAAPWDSPINSSTPTFDYTVTVPGTYTYQCTPHASMGMTASFVASGIATAIAPTPFDDAFTATVTDGKMLDLSYVVSGHDRVIVSLFDLTGKAVKNLSDQQAVVGMYNETYSIADLPTGMYFVVAQIGYKRNTQRIVVR